MTLPEEGQTVRVRFDDIAPKGDGIATTEFDLPVYAAGAIPGEEALVTVRKVRRNYIAADIEQIIAPSKDRVEPKCPLFGSCSGCQLQHVDYPRQLELKRRMVVAQLQRFGDLEDPPVLEVIGAEQPWNYRNHARFTVKDGHLGFVRRFKRQWFEVPHCYIMDPGINDILAKVQGKLDGATQCNIRIGMPPEPLMVQPKLDLEALGIPTGQKRITQKLHGHSFRVGSASFFQVNRAQAERLIDVVRDRVAVTKDTVVADAYAGVGTFAALLAPHVKHVIAIEESAQAVEDAQFALADLDNVEIRKGKAEDLLPELKGQVDVVILDPPRNGCQEPALNALKRMRPRRVIYVSCDPSTLGRDLKILCQGDGPFKIVHIQPVDMFPQTHHVETVTTLDLVENAGC